MKECFSPSSRRIAMNAASLSFFLGKTVGGEQLPGETLSDKEIGGGVLTQRRSTSTAANSDRLTTSYHCHISR